MFSNLETLLRLNRLFGRHPLTKNARIDAFLRFFGLQIGCRLTGSPLVYRWIGGARLIVGPGMTGVTGELYTGLLEFEDTLFCLHLLRSDELFVDVGANAGTYTIATAFIGNCRVVAFEPDEKAMAMLEEHILLNKLDSKVKVVNLGLSDRRREVSFTQGKDALNRIVESDTEELRKIQVDALDNVLSEVPTAIKIDVEGHEMSVLRGAEKALSSQSLLAAIVETGVSARVSGVLNFMTAHGFVPCDYDPHARCLSRKSALSNHNTIFVRDFDVVQERLKTAKSVKVSGCYI